MAERLALLEKLLAVYTRRYDEMARTITLELGAPATMSREQQAHVCIQTWKPSPARLPPLAGAPPLRGVRACGLLQASVLALRSMQDGITEQPCAVRNGEAVAEPGPRHRADVRAAVDGVHAEGPLKPRIAADPARFDHAWETREDCRRFIPRPPSSYLAQLHFDTMVFEPEQLLSESARAMWTLVTEQPPRVLRAPGGAAGIEEQTAAAAALAHTHERARIIVRPRGPQRHAGREGGIGGGNQDR